MSPEMYDTQADVRRAYVWGAVCFANGLFVGLIFGWWWL